MPTETLPACTQVVQVKDSSFRNYKGVQIAEALTARETRACTDFQKADGIPQCVSNGNR